MKDAINWLDATPEQMIKAVNRVSKTILKEIKNITAISTGALEQSLISDPHIKIMPCPVCSGTGKIPRKHKKGKKKCKSCKGTGSDIKYVVDGEAKSYRFVEYGMKNNS